MAGSMKLGGGGRFAALKSKLAAEPDVRDPAALAAAVGRKKYGAGRFDAMAAKGAAKPAPKPAVADPDRMADLKMMVGRPKK